MPEASCRRTSLLALIGALLVAPACSTLKLEPPQLSVVTMKVQSADIFSQRLQMRLRVVNPNDRELPIKADYVGKNLPTALEQSVQVRLQEIDEVDEVLLQDGGAV